MAVTLFQLVLRSVVAVIFIRLSSAGVLEKRQGNTCNNALCVLSEALLPSTFSCTQTSYSNLCPSAMCECASQTIFLGVPTTGTIVQLITTSTTMTYATTTAFANPCWYSDVAAAGPQITPSSCGTPSSIQPISSTTPSSIPSTPSSIQSIASTTPSSIPSTPSSIQSIASTTPSSIPSTPSSTQPIASTTPSSIPISCTIKSTTTAIQGVTLSGPACVCNDGKPPSLLSAGQKCANATASPTCMTTSYVTSTTSSVTWFGGFITTISYPVWNCSCNDWATPSVVEPLQTCGTLTAPTNCDSSIPVLNPNFENLPVYDGWSTASGEGCACAPTWGAVPTTAMLTFPQPGVNMQGTCGGPSCPVTMSSIAPHGTDWEVVPFCNCQSWGSLNTQSYSNNPCSGVTVTSTATATCTSTTSYYFDGVGDEPRPSCACVTSTGTQRFSAPNPPINSCSGYATFVVNSKIP